MIRVNEEIDGVKVNLAIKTFKNFEEAADYCYENNKQNGSHLYYIDPEDFPED
jgi:hypothetical protein